MRMQKWTEKMETKEFHKSKLDFVELIWMANTTVQGRCRLSYFMDRFI